LRKWSSDSSSLFIQPAPSILKCKIFWFILSQNNLSLTNFIEKVIIFWKLNENK
jgi:hypothetical protein